MLSPEHAGPADADDDAHLTARRTGKELTEGDDLRKRILVEPFTSLHEFGIEVAEMRDRTAERAEPEPQKGREDLAGPAPRGHQLVALHDDCGDLAIELRELRITLVEARSLRTLHDVHM